ncbi:hypothetical protein H7I76_16895 [Mycolicibacterium vaccae]|nr:hypothetical protein [Mycolicibacterium vaccae]
MANKAVAVGATAAGMAAATVGRMLRWPGLPDSVEAAVVAVDYQPRLRQLLETGSGTRHRHRLTIAY